MVTGSCPVLICVYPRPSVAGLILERAVRFELTYTGFAIRRLAAWRRAQIGAEGEIRTLDSSLEDSQVSSYRHFRRRNFGLRNANCGFAFVVACTIEIADRCYA